MKVKLNSNMITGVLFLIVSVALHILIPSQIRTYETSAVTAATVPTLLIRGMILCSVILLVQGILSKEKTEYTISGAIFTKENLLRLKPVIYIAMLIAYALLLPHIGFIIFLAAACQWHSAVFRYEKMVVLCDCQCKCNRCVLCISGNERDSAIRRRKRIC